jgi:DinB superfamily
MHSIVHTQQGESIMPQLATPIADAIDAYGTNEYLLNNALSAITPEESLRQPGLKSNHAVWILGHLIYCRNSVLKFLGQSPTEPHTWLPLFNRGAKLVEASAYPAWSELLSVWQETIPILHKALEEAPEELLDQPAPQGIPSADKKMSGVFRFFAIHEAYHVGQLGYLDKWLGHDGPVG